MVGPSDKAKVGVTIPPDLPAGVLVDYARRAEAVGFDEIWVVEDCFFRGGIAQAAVVLARTARIRVGIGILPAGARNAAFAALEVATLAELFPGRLAVGIGHGMPTWMRQTGSWSTSPVTLLEEYILTVKRILSGAEVTIAGQFVRMQGVQLARPPTVEPPVYAGVRGPRSLAASGRVADGTILAEPVTPEYLRFVLGQVGASAPAHEILAYNVAAVDDSGRRARAVARAALKWIGDPDWAAQIAPLPFAAELNALRERAGSRDEFAARLPDDWVEQLAVAGTPREARGRLQLLEEAGAGHLILQPAGSDPLAALDAVARVVTTG